MASENEDSGSGSRSLWDRLFGGADEAAPDPEPDPVEETDAKESGGFFGDSFDALADAAESVSEAATSAMQHVADSDPDGDGLTTAEEIRLGTDPGKSDTDGDTWDDGIEHLTNSDPLVADRPNSDPPSFFEDPLSSMVNTADEMTGGIARDLLSQLDPNPTEIQPGTDPNIAPSGPASDDPGFFKDPLGTIAGGVDDMTGGIAGRLGDAFEEVGKADPDGDGVPTATEIRIGTDPAAWEDNPDTDGDHLSDRYEVELGSDPGSHDSDRDGLTDFQELDLGTDPNLKDTDGDGVDDFAEVNVFETDPSRPPSGPGRPVSPAPSVDLADLTDAEIDDMTVAELEELTEDDFDIPASPMHSQTADDDNDGIANDMDEVGAVFAARAYDTDSDRDGLTDVAEARLGTDPTNRDTDGDKMPDLTEIRLGTDPLVADEMPANMLGLGLESDGTEEGDLFVHMGKVEGILMERQEALSSEPEGPETNDELIEAETATTDPFIERVDEALANLGEDAPAPEVVVEEPTALSDEPTETFETIETIDAAVDSLLVDGDDLDGE